LKDGIKTQAFSDSSWRWMLEWAAVLSNVSFTILYLNQSQWAFPMGIIGPLLLLVLSWRERLYAEPVLQLMYIVSALVGWYHVQAGWKTGQLETSAQITLLAASIALAIIWGWTLKRFTNANFPRLDALVAAWGMLATWLMMFQVHSCWLYLMAVNVLSIFIYFRRRLFLVACMFVLYLIMSVDGYFQLHWFEL
jgi:nicotinamide mononucleotide transporter